MKRLTSVVFALVLLLGLAQPASAAPDYTAWLDLGIVYSAPSGSAYYPSILYDAAGFGAGPAAYKMWYSDGSGGVFVTSSSDGVTWGAPASATGLSAGAHHVQVLYDATCFAAVPCDTSAARYRIWYWASPALYSIEAIHSAQSVDGVAWTGDAAAAQTGTPLITTTGWNRGTYGPIALSYRPGAANTGADPWGYSFVMYFDGTDGSSEVTGLAYSADGLTWTAYSSSPVLDRSSGPLWDCEDSAFGGIIHDANGYHFWYSGGGGNNGSGVCESSPVEEGIGVASSSDGLTWSKSPTNPIFHISQAVTWRNERIYAPAMVDNGSGLLRMYYSAKRTTDSVKRIGLAVMASAPATTYVDDDWAGMALLTPVTFPGEAGTHYVGIDAFAAIQPAIGAVSAGGTVKVAAGTYRENVVVNKSVTIAGAGESATEVQPTVSAPNPCEGSSLCAGAASNVFLVQANDVLIHDLTVNGDNPTLTSGIVRAGADLDARNGIIKNTDATYNNLEVRNVTVKNIYLRGIYSTGGTFNFHHNTVTNVQGDGYSIGMFAWYGPGTMANNNVSYTNDAISANHSKGIQFLNNTVTNSASGIHTDNSGDSAGCSRRSDPGQQRDVLFCRRLRHLDVRALHRPHSQSQHDHRLRSRPFCLGPGCTRDHHLQQQHGDRLWRGQQHRRLCHDRYDRLGLQ